MTHYPFCLLRPKSPTKKKDKKRDKAGAFVLPVRRHKNKNEKLIIVKEVNFVVNNVLYLNMNLLG